MKKLKKPFLFFLALLLMMGLIGFTTHVFADDEDTEIQTSTEVITDEQDHANDTDITEDNTENKALIDEPQAVDNSSSGNLIHLDLNVILNGNCIYSFPSGLNADVYINDQLIETNVNDFNGDYADGTKYKFVLHPDTTKYRCIETEIQGVLTSENGNFKHIEAILYSIGERKLTVTGDEGIESIQGNGSYAIGSDATVTYTVKPGYHITKVTGDYYITSPYEGKDGLLDHDGEWTNLAGKTGTVSESYQVPPYDRTLQVHTESDKHTITIDPNGGTYGGNSGVTTVNSEYGASYELNEIPVRDGYTFSGWKSSENSVLHSGNWSDKSDEITLTEKKDNDGVVYSNYVLNYTNNTQNITWPNIYFFNYSYESGHTYELLFDVRVNSLSGLKYISIRHAAFRNNVVTPASNLSYVIPEWTHETLTRTFTGHTFTQDGVETELNPLIELFSELSPGDTGKFDLDLKNVTVYDVTAKKYVSSLSNSVKVGTTVEMGDSDATVTAVWEPNTYKVSYDINGGTGTIEDQTFTYGNTAGETISATKPTKKGYTFAGWRWDDPNDETNFRLFDPGDKIPSDLQDFTLHAIWVANGYHVTFEGNGADSGTMSDEAFTYDDNEKSLTANNFAREGYRFVGWNTKADGSGQSYTDAQAIKNISEGGETILVNTNSLQFNQVRNGSSSDMINSTTTNNPVKDLNSLTSGIVYSTTVTNATYEYGGVYSQPLETFMSDFKTFFADKKMNISFKARSDKPMSITRVGFESASNRSSIRLDSQWNTYSITVQMYSSIDDWHALTFYNAQQPGTYYVGDLNVTMGGEVKLYAQWEKLTDLKVNAVVSGNMGSRDKEFSFITQFPSSLYNKNLTVEKSDGTTNMITIDDSGVASFTLKHGESITFKDLTAEQANAVKALPDFGIKEQDYSSEGYSTVYSVSSEPDGTLVVSYRNTKQSAVSTGNHIGTGITAVVLIGIAGLVVMFQKKRK